MAQASYIDVPALQEKAYKKSLIKYQGIKGSIVAIPFKNLSRSQLSALKSRTWLHDMAAIWASLDAPTKLLWKNYRASSMRSAWTYFVQEYSYRRKYGLSLPPDPNEFHQMHGLKLNNATGIGEIKAENFNIAITGGITVEFDYKKNEVAEASGPPFYVLAEAVYLLNGENISETYLFEADSGTTDWQNISFNFGTPGRYYFELVVSFVLDAYQASVIIDNFKITDSIGILVDEPFHVKAGKTWEYQIRTRKMGWQFTPAFTSPELEIIYTGE